MSLEAQLSAGGQLVFLLLASTLWIGGGLLGLLLPGPPSPGGQPLSLAERWALRAPWGLTFGVSLCAAMWTGGRSQLTAAALLMAAVSGASAWRRGETPVPTAFRASEAGRLLAAALALLLVSYMVFLLGIMPAYGDGVWHKPFFDYGWYGLLAQGLVDTGVEHFSIATVPAVDDAGRGRGAWYHWTDLWLAGLLVRGLGLSPPLVLSFVVYPLLLAMTGLAGAALFHRLSGIPRGHLLFGVSLLFATSYVNRGGPWRIDSFYWFVPLAYYTNFSLSILLCLSTLLWLVLGARLQAAFNLALAIYLGPGLLPLLGTALPLAAASEMWLRWRRGLPAWGPLAVFSALTLGLTALLLCWLPVVGLSLRSEATHSYTQQASLTFWLGVARDSATSTLLGSLLGLPFLVGALFLARERGTASRPVWLALSAFLVAYPAAVVLRGDGVEKNIPWLMWSALMVPLGWAGLSLRLARGPNRMAAFLVMAPALLGGALATREAFRSELFRYPDFLMETTDVRQLRQRCGGERVGYFCMNPCRDVGQWWVSVHSSWSALSECRFLRLNRREQDTRGMSLGIWQRAAPARWAREHRGGPWRNTPDHMLGFARSLGIRLIVEAPGYPVPEELRPALSPLGPAGPFTFYRLEASP